MCYRAFLLLILANKTIRQPSESKTRTSLALAPFYRNHSSVATGVVNGHHNISHKVVVNRIRPFNKHNGIRTSLVLKCQRPQFRRVSKAI